MGGDQLRLSIPQAPASRLPAHLRPGQPTLAPGPFDDPGYLFEPWWPGVRTLAYLEGGALRLETEGLADATAAFPELGDELPGLLSADAVVLDGTLLLLDRGGHLAADLLRRRLAGERRVGRPAFVASDLLWCDGVSLMRRRFASRRQRLQGVVSDGDRCVVGRALRGEGRLMAEALATMGMAAMSARRLDARHRAGPAGDAWLRVPLAAEPRVDVRPTLALIQRLPLPDG